MITSAAPIITADGITAPAFAEILEFLQDKYRQIYGADIYLGNDSQDGQFLGLIAREFSNNNSAIIECYNSRSPLTAYGDALSRNVQINGISRKVPTNSTVTLVLIGVAGTTINNGYVADQLENLWALPSPLVIGVNGQVTATATCQTIGAVIAAPNTVNRISTPTRGWQTATNPSSAIIGAPVETDLALRKRQAKSVSIPSQSMRAGIEGALLSLDGVVQARVFENDTDKADFRGLPPHSIAAVVVGGVSTEIAQTIFTTKSSGCRMIGNTEVGILDNNDNPAYITYYAAEVVTPTIEVRLRANAGYSDAIGTRIAKAVSDYVNALEIGETASNNKLLLPASLYGDISSTTYEVLQIIVTIGSVDSEDLNLLYYQIAACTVDDIIIGVN